MFDSCSLDLPPYRGFVAAVYNGPALASVLRELPRLLSSASVEILQDGRNKIYAVRFPPAEYPTEKDMGPSKSAAGEAVVKIFGARGFHKLKTLLLPSKGIRAWRGAVALREGGFETPFPIAAYERRRFGVAVESVFVAERLRGGQEIRGLFRDLPEMDLRALIAGLAPVLADLHNAGLVHRDLSDGNVLVFFINRDQSSNPLRNSLLAISSDTTAMTPLPPLPALSTTTTTSSGFQFSSRKSTDACPGTNPILGTIAPKSALVIPAEVRPWSSGSELPARDGFHFLDTNRVRKRPRLGNFGRARNLVRLGVPVSLRSFFLDQYALAVGPSFPRTRFAFYYRTAKRAFEFWLAFKKAFRLRTIARKLGLQ